MTGTIFGYDPGGDGKHGWAELQVTDSVATGLTLLTLPDVRAVLARVRDARAPLALGVDTLTQWSAGRCGWRPADVWLRKRYPGAAVSVKSPNGLRGSMSVNGMAVIFECRRMWPELPVCETHPKVLYYALAGARYSADSPQERNARLHEWFGGVWAMPRHDDEWDAAISALAALNYLAGRWTRDLHAIEAGDAADAITPAGVTQYPWPE